MSDPGPPADYAEADVFAEAFLDLERELGMFAHVLPNGTAWWDAVRYDVYRFAYARASGIRQPAIARPPFRTRLANLWTRQRLRASLMQRLRHANGGAMVLRAPRQMRNGAATDIALDQIIGCLDESSIVIDTYPHYYHLRPRLPFSRNPDLPSEATEFAHRLVSMMQLPASREEISGVAIRALAGFHHALRGYRTMLAKSKPRLVLLTQNGMEKALFQAAREIDATSLEAQHGLIGVAHPGYSYPTGVDYSAVATLPDLFLAFSDYWLSRCHYPARRTEVVGDDAFFIEALPPLDAGDVLFVAADVYHAALIEFLVPTARALPSRKFLYKLHPNMQPNFSAICRELADLPNVVVVPGHVRATGLLGHSSHVVLVQSTFALEAVQAGRRLCVIPRLNYRVHDDLLELDAVTLCADSPALAAALSLAAPRGVPKRFFEPFDPQATRALLGSARAVP